MSGAGAPPSGGAPGRAERPIRHRLPAHEPLSADELESVHRSALQVLREVGIQILDGRARALLRSHGAEVDEGSEVARLDPEMAEAWAAKAPASFEMRSRGGARLEIGGDRVVFSCVASPPNCTDIDRGWRVGSFSDYRDLVRIGHMSEALEALGGYPVEPQDLPPETRHLDAFRFALLNTDKPISTYALGPNRIRDAAEIMRRGLGLTDADFQEGAWLNTVVNTSSPLRLDSNMIEGMFEMAALNQPVVFTPFTLSGAMAPATVAGALVQQHAEAIAAIALFQMMRPGGGARCVYGGFTSNVDLRSGAPAFGTPEYVLAVAAGGQLARRLRVPYRSSNVCASNAVDAQCAYETMFSLWALMLGRAHLVKHGAGWMEGGLVASYEKMMMDAELILRMRDLTEALEAGAGGAGAAASAAEALRRGGPGALRAEAGSEAAEAAGALAGAARGDARRRWNRAWKRALAEHEAPPLDAGRVDMVDEYIELRRREGGAETAPSVRSP